MSLFDKIILSTDIHFGLKGNSIQHNRDCLNFLDWLIIEAKKDQIDTFCFLGDWLNNRRSVEVSTLNYSFIALEKLSNAFKKCYFIEGNHDLFYRERRDLNSIPYANKFPNIVLVDDILVQDEVAFIPWLIPDEWKKLREIKCRYMLGHFELPGFLTNSVMEMPDHGELRPEYLTGPEYVFSGHFHKRQKKGNVIYIGNAFPHNYNDVFDQDRGLTILSWGGKPEFRSWPGAPEYKILKLSELVQSPAKYLNDRTSIRVILDLPLSFEEATILKESFQEEYNPREFSLVPNNADIEEFDFTGEIKFESVDQIVMNGLNSLDSTTLDKKLLIDIYQNLGMSNA